MTRRRIGLEDGLEESVLSEAISSGVLTAPQVEVARRLQRLGPWRVLGLLGILHEALDSEPRLRLWEIYERLSRGRVASPPADSAPTLSLEALEALGEGPQRNRRVGALVGPYELEAELGQGGIGLVYRARHRGTERRVALKVLLRGRRATPIQVERFRLEAAAAGRLEHPNIVPVLDHGCDSAGTWWTAMELVEGVSLASRIEDGPLALSEAVRIARDLAAALATAHREGVLHRDLKPHNVLLEADGTPRLTDFGLAKLTAQLGPALTESGSILGTPAYMSPEQADGSPERASEAVDVYGLGATLYHMLTGAPPFPEASLTAVLISIVSSPAPAPSLARSSVDEALDAIVLKCLAKDPAQRYPSAEELGQELTRWLAGAQVLAHRPPSKLPRIGRFVRLAAPLALGLLLFAGLLSVGLFVSGRRSSVADSSRLQWGEADRPAPPLTPPRDYEGLTSGEDEGGSSPRDPARRDHAPCHPAEHEHEPRPRRRLSPCRPRDWHPPPRHGRPPPRHGRPPPRHGHPPPRHGHPSPRHGHGPFGP